MQQKARNFPHRVDDTVAVWEEFKEISQRYSCLSLGEGAPSEAPPEYLVKELMTAIEEGHNQYTRSFGHTILVEKLAEVYGKKINRKIDPMTEVLVGPGGTNVIINSLIAYINPGQGEEVIVFEPCWPSYINMIQYAGGVYRPAPLLQKGDQWVFDEEEFKKVINSKTKLLILNNAQNPTGKLFSREELEQLSKILDDYPDVIILSDDVYEFLAYGGEFVPFASIGNNFQRTLSCYDGGKLFNATGWTVAWALGPSDLVRPVGVITMTLVYCSHSPSQVAMARALDKIEDNYKEGHSYVGYLKNQFMNVRDYVTSQLKSMIKDIPIIPLKCDSGFFIMADISQAKDMIPQRFLDSHDFEELKEGETLLSKNKYFIDGRVPLDLAFCRWIAVERGVIMMPCSLFYHEESQYRSDHYVRIAICKGMDFTVKAIKKLQGKQD